MNKIINKTKGGFTRTNSKRSLGGFTIIEVMVVLAIAGLIMAIILIAVPQLQRNARDNQRQNTLLRVKGEMETYAANNSGTYPFQPGCNTGGCWRDFYTRYIQGGNVNDKDPSGSSIFGAAPDNYNPAPCNGYRSAGSDCTSSVVPGIGTASVVYGAKCNGEKLVAATTGAPTVNMKNYAVIIGLDRANTYYCADNG